MTTIEEQMAQAENSLQRSEKIGEVGETVIKKNTTGAAVKRFLEEKEKGDTVHIDEICAAIGAEKTSVRGALKFFEKTGRIHRKKKHLPVKFEVRR